MSELAHEPVVAPPRHWARELAQPWMDDVVLAAAYCKPNAAGGSELSLGGLRRRQLLKGSCRYVGERVVVGVTPLEVCLLEVGAAGLVQRPVGCWARDAVAVTTVPADHPVHPDLPAFVIGARGRRPAAELQVLRRDDDAAVVLDLLLR